LLYIFSSSAAPFEPGKTYSKFEAFAVLNHGGDFASAARSLANDGYGEKSFPLKANLITNQTAGTSKANAAWELCLDDEVIGDGDAQSIAGPVDGLSDGNDKRTFQMFTLGALKEKHFPDPMWVIEGLLSEGLNILAGKPKMGKSILALNLGLTVSGGGLALGDTPVHQGDVLYLALEDKFRRVKDRALKMAALAGRGSDKRLVLATEWPRCDAGGLKLLDKWVAQAERPRLVIIDVWPMFKPLSKPGSRKNAYDEDYSSFGDLKKFCDNRGINCLVLLHCRKGLSEDVLDEVSGTLGQVGASDGILVLNRSRTNNEAKVFVCGRDVDEKELSLSFDLPTLTWKSLGRSADHIKGELQKKVIGYLSNKNNSQPAKPKDIADSIGSSRQDVQKVLDRFLDRNPPPVRKLKDGWILSDDVEEC
jgi:hypothetical protein